MRPSLSNSTVTSRTGNSRVEVMTQITIDEAILRAARAYAVERGTTVSALVRDYLAEVVREMTADEAAREKGRKELVALSERSSGRLGPDWNWNREDVYRERLSRFQNPRSKGDLK